MSVADLTLHALGEGADVPPLAFPQPGTTTGDVVFVLRLVPHPTFTLSGICDLMTTVRRLRSYRIVR